MESLNVLLAIAINLGAIVLAIIRVTTLFNRSEARFNLIELHLKQMNSEIETKVENKAEDLIARHSESSGGHEKISARIFRLERRLGIVESRVLGDSDTFSAR